MPATASNSLYFLIRPFASITVSVTLPTLAIQAPGVFQQPVEHRVEVAHLSCVEAVEQSSLHLLERGSQSRQDMTAPRAERDHDRPAVVGACLSVHKAL